MRTHEHPVPLLAATPCPWCEGFELGVLDTGNERTLCCVTISPTAMWPGPCAWIPRDDQLAHSADGLTTVGHLRDELNALAAPAEITVLSPATRIGRFVAWFRSAA